MLQQIEPLEVPEPLQNFEEKTWLKLRDQLPEKGGFFASSSASNRNGHSLGNGCCWLQQRFWPDASGLALAKQSCAADTFQVNPQRVVLVAVGDHLETIADAAGGDHEL